MEKLISVKGAAELLGVSVALVYKWSCARNGPRFVKVGTRTMFRIEDLEKFIAERTVEPVSGGGSR